MTGNECRARTVFGKPQTPQRDRSGQDSRLGLVGLIELRLWPLLRQSPKIIVKDSRCFGKGIADNGLLAAKFRQHAQRLGALPRKDESE